MRARSKRRISAIAALVGAVAFGAGAIDTGANAAPAPAPAPGPEGIPYDDLGVSLPEFRLAAATWSDHNITYSFDNGTPDIAGSGERDAIRLAFDLWEAQSPLRFTEVANGGEIVILWATGNHNDGGFGANVLAHAYYPSSHPLGGDAHFNDAYTWSATLPLPPNTIDLVTVAAHEFGHSIGIGHLSNAGAIMYPMYTGPHRYLAPADITAVQNLYGGGGPTEPPAPLPKVSISDVTVIEPDKGSIAAVFEITLSAPATKATKVKFRTEDVSATVKDDYRIRTGTATIQKGKTTALVRVRVKQDAFDEPTETFRVVLHSPVRAEIDDGTGIGTIIDAVGG